MNHNDYKEIAIARKLQLEAAESKIQDLASVNNRLRFGVVLMCVLFVVYEIVQHYNN